MLLDHDHLARQTFGDADLAAELLGLFVQQCHRLLPGIVDPGRPAIDRADLAHTLKGSALGIGAMPIADLAATIEDALRAGADIDAAGRRLEAAVADTLGEIARVV